ncbi:MAG: glycosyltransferase family 9 protein [Candidatus Latescibacterota bacterium]|nr:MAG: glycosyltransferase family 9 protein [Candidatus Latescibacterota bacterium]
MGMIKTLERRGKRFLIGLTTRLVRTQPMTPEAVLADKPNRFLVIRQHNQMGDMLLATPAFRAIKESCPGSHLCVVTAPINRDVLLNNPHVDSVFTYNNRNPFSTIRLIRDLRRGHHDMVVVLHTVSFSFTSAIIGLLAGARIRAGSTSGPFESRLSKSLYHLELPLPDKGELERMNEAEHNLVPLRTLGIDTDDLSPLFIPTASDQEWADEFLARRATGGNPCIVVHPGAGKKENVWAPANFADVVNRLAAASPIDLFVVEGPRDAENVGMFGRSVRVAHHVLFGRKIGEIAAVLRRADLVLCNDTGVMHVACAAGANTLAVFGPTDPIRWAPRCANLTVVRAENGNLKKLSVPTVYDKAAELLRLVHGGKGDSER